MMATYDKHIANIIPNGENLKNFEESCLSTDELLTHQQIYKQYLRKLFENIATLV